jgi:SHS2 domain-containing protein
MSYAFRFLDDIAIADIAFEAEGDSAEELFVGATKALLEVLANPVTIADTWQRQVLKREGT